MKIILPSAITSLTASSQDSNLPAINLLHESPGVVWRAASSAVTSATLDLTTTVTAPHALVLHAVQGGTVTLQQWSGSAWVAPADLVADSLYDPYLGRTTWWFEWTATTGGIRMLLTIPQQSAGVVIQAGCLTIGEMLTIGGVQYPLAEGVVDSSLTLQMSDGSINYRPRARWRTYAGTVLGDRATGMLPFLRKLGRLHGSVPVAAHMSPEGGDDYFIWGRFGMPQGSHAWPMYGQVQFSVDEVV